MVTAQISSSWKWGSGGSVSFSLNGGAASSADAVSFQPSRGGHEHHSSDGLMQASTSTFATVTPGANTFTLEYEIVGDGYGAASFANRTITVIPLN